MIKQILFTLGSLLISGSVFAASLNQVICPKGVTIKKASHSVYLDPKTNNTWSVTNSLGRSYKLVSPVASFSISTKPVKHPVLCCFYAPHGAYSAVLLALTHPKNPCLPGQKAKINSAHDGFICK